MTKAQATSRGERRQYPAVLSPSGSDGYVGGLTGAAEPATAVVPRLPMLRVERRAVWWWMLRAAVRWGALLAALVVAAVLWDDGRPWLIAPIVAAGAVLLAKMLVEPWWRYRVHRWEVAEHATYATNGWLVVEWRVAPTSRIQTVDAVRGPIEQLLGLSTLRVTTASSYGSIDINGLDQRTAQEAVTRLSAVAELTPGDAT
ncbi:PH domain-containing protein [Hoyosella sp. YIM 151337]|uniref:PH domain-containing protein n=1 Tax=Hoyosella sp. YIM 151337 TaxID=2992742 RepID=UPI002235F61F|nr:PH domain-containing protein [Hoyosella sp. YIM 151337]MCW4353447.1 PH domain-containing protein [Hoyosella sp. YIM 151337]